MSVERDVFVARMPPWRALLGGGELSLHLVNAFGPASVKSGRPDGPEMKRLLWSCLCVFLVALAVALMTG
jgi:hypothetical protein